MQVLSKLYLSFVSPIALGSDYQSGHTVVTPTTKQQTFEGYTGEDCLDDSKLSIGVGHGQMLIIICHVM